MWWLKAIAAWEAAWWLVGKVDRRNSHAKAEALARSSGKPFLVVGEPDGEYACPDQPGDALVDLRQTSVCKNHVVANIEDLSRFQAKQFGAAFVSHTIEHVCDPQRAMAELARVAEHVIVSYPRWWRIATWLVPGHIWIVTERAGALRFTRIRSGSGCNAPTRYGLGDVLEVAR